MRTTAIDLESGNRLQHSSFYANPATSGVPQSGFSFGRSALSVSRSALGVGRLPRGIRRWAFYLFLSIIMVKADAQISIHGTVFNMYKTRPLDGVSVVCSCGIGTTTDSNGNYSIRVNADDSLRFSYLGRATQYFPVTMMNTTTGFDIALHVNPTELAEVRVAPKNYYLDSLQNRKDYEKIFNYTKPGLALSDGSSGSGVGLDLDQLINVFRFKRNRRLLAFQERLIEDEHDKFIDHRFTRYIVKKITGLTGDAEDSFMRRFRPSYEFTKIASDYEFYDYIKLAYQDYKRQQTYYRRRYYNAPPNNAPPR